MSAVKACVRCVGVLALALALRLKLMPHKAAGMHRNWRKQHGKLILCPIPSFPFSPPFSHFPLCSSLSLFFSLYVEWVYSPSVPCRQVFWPETIGWCVSSCGCGPVSLITLPRSSREQWKRPKAVTGQLWGENPLHVRKSFQKISLYASELYSTNFGITNLGLTSPGCWQFYS